MPGEIPFTTNEDDLVAGNRLHARQLWNLRAVLRGWLLFAAVLSLLWFGLCERIGWDLLWVPLVSAAWMVIGWIVSQLTFARAARRSFREIKPFLRPTTIAWDGASVRFSSERGESRDDWISYYAWAADDRSVLLYQAANLFITLPVRDLGENAKIEIVDALKKAGVKERLAR